MTHRSILSLIILAVLMGPSTAWALRDGESMSGQASVPYGSASGSIDGRHAAPSGFVALPDEGPRVEPTVSSEQAAVLRPGRDAFERGEYEAALWALQRVEEQAASPALIAHARAYRAEATYRRQATPQYRLDAIELYQSLSREYPESSNASRAGWRIGDLYAELGWRVEAQAAYERAAKNATVPADTQRAFLGLGLSQLAAEQWSAAVQTLQGLKRGQYDDRTTGLVTLGLAEGLYGLRRLREAGELYQQLAHKWPALLHQTPEALLHLADLEQSSGQQPRAREFYLRFYNLYPRHREAPAVLVKVGDSLWRAGFSRQAETIYAAAIEWHGDAEAASIARLRMADIGQAMAREAGGDLLKLEIAGAFQHGLQAPVSQTEQQRVLESVGEAHRDTALGSEALLQLAEHYLQWGKQPQAQAAFHQACKREGRIAGDVWPGRARHQLAQLLRPEMAGAIRMADDWHAVQLFHRFGDCPDWKSGHLDLVLHLAEAHRRLGFSEPSIKLYQIVLKESQVPEYRQHALIGLGRAYLDQADGPAARKVFERYQLEYPLGVLKGDALKYLAEAWSVMGDATAASKASQRWFKWQGDRASQDPGYGQMLLRLADAQVAVGTRAEAIATIRLAEQAGVLPYVEARLREGRYRELAGYPKEAATQWAEVLRVEPDSSVARFRLGRVWLQHKRLAEAEIVLDKLESRPTGDLFERAAAVLKADVAVEQHRRKEEQP